MWRCGGGQRGGDLVKVIENDSAVVLGGQRYTFLTTTNTVVRVDNINIATPDTDRTTYTYNNGNELLTMVKDSGTTTFTYDDWGRQVSKIVGANSAVYTYRFGSMLKEINSTIPGEADLVQYAYDAFNKRREVRVSEASKPVLGGTGEPGNIAGGVHAGGACCRREQRGFHPARPYSGLDSAPRGRDVAPSG